MYGTGSFDSNFYVLETDNANFFRNILKTPFLLCYYFTEHAAYLFRLRKEEEGEAYITMSSCSMQMFRVVL